MMFPWKLFLVFWLGLMISTMPHQVHAVGCFVCTSFNGSDPSCTDPFHPAWGNYIPSCQQGLKGRVGLFPAFYCVKMSGKNRQTHLELVVRTCSIESMNHQCGLFLFDDQQYEGCLTSCPQDGCNSAHSRRASCWWGVALFVGVHLFVMSL